MKRQLIYIITRSDLGGAQNHVLSLISRFNQEFDILLVTASEGYLTRRARKLGVAFALVPELDSFNAWTATVKLFKIIKSRPQSLVHTHSSLASAYGRLAAKLNGSFSIYTVHGWHFSNSESWLSSIFLRVVEILLRPATDIWITVSKFDLEIGIRNLLVREKDAVFIANGIPDAGPFERTLSPKLRVVMIGRACHQKNLGAAIRIMELVDKNVELTIYTSGKGVQELLARVSGCSAKDQISVFLDRDTAQLDLADFDVMMLTSRYEGMPLSVLEGMRAALPIVSSNVCGMSELVDSSNGVLVEQNDLNGFALVINKLNSQREQLMEMGINSRIKFVREFEESKMIGHVRDLYNNLST